MASDDESDPAASDLADLSALADGTLESSRRAAVEARIAASPELSAVYERERRVVAALHQARATERAPAGLRARIEAVRPSRGAAARRRIGYAGALAAAVAAVVLVLVLALPSGAPGGPSVSEAAALAARGPTQPAPPRDPAHPYVRLNQSVGDVYFPDWTWHFGWRAVGQRIDRLGGRTAVTVYYQWQGQRVAYTIVAAPALPQPAGQRTTVDGTPMRVFAHDGHPAVTWRQSGDTCLLLALSDNGVNVYGLEKLAAWKVPTDGH